MTTTTVDLILALLLCSKVTSLSVQNHDFNSIVVEADDTDYEEIRYHQNQTLERIMISKSKVVNITCPELNNVTFTNQPPFDILGIPQCWNKIEPELRLYLNDANKTECELEVRQLPNANTTRCFELLKRHSEAKKVVIVTHGFLNNFDTRWLHTMKDAIQEVEPGTAVIVSHFFIIRKRQYTGEIVAKKAHLRSICARPTLGLCSCKLASLESCTTGLLGS